MNESVNECRNFISVSDAALHSNAHIATLTARNVHVSQTTFRNQNPRTATTKKARLNKTVT